MLPNLELMVHKQPDLKKAFAARLHEAIDKVPDAPKRHGRAVWLASKMQVTPKGAGKWLKGDAIPSSGRFTALAALLKCSASWLHFGEGETPDDAGVGEVLTPNESAVLSLFRNMTPGQQALWLEQGHEIAALAVRARRHPPKTGMAGRGVVDKKKSTS